MKKNGQAHNGEALVMEAEKIVSKNGKANRESPTENRQEIQLPELDFRQIRLKVEGIAPLIVNNFSEKAKTQMLEKQMGKAKKGKEFKNPEEQYKGSLYMFPDNKRTGFPAVGFKAAMTRAGKLLGLHMVDTRGKFHVLGDSEGNGLVEISGKHRKREDMVRLQGGVADIRFRAEYPKWSAELVITYNASWISHEQLAQILNVAGFSCGIGEWRPEKSSSGSFGLFKVV